MKKQTLTDTTTPTAKLSDEKSHTYALRVAGTHFTQAFIAGSKNPKIKDFRDDAENCLSKVKKQNKAKLWTSFWVLATLILALFAAFRCYEAGCSAGAILRDWLIIVAVIVAMFTAFIGWLYGNCNLRTYDRPGDTTKMVAKAWRPLRKKILLDTDVMPTLARSIKWADEQSELYKEIERWQFGGKALEKLLALTLDVMAERAANSFKAVEIDGTKHDQKRYRNQFGLIDKIGQALGFERLDWKQLNH